MAQDVCLSEQTELESEFSPSFSSKLIFVINDVPTADRILSSLLFIYFQVYNSPHFKWQTFDQTW